MRTAREPSDATASGALSFACTAAPPSPEKPAVPVPARVSIRPEGPWTQRMTLLPVSAMSRSVVPAYIEPHG